METRFNRRYQCKGKRRYEQEQATRYAEDLGAKQGEPMRAYHCPWCYQWHVGHSAKVDEVRAMGMPRSDIDKLEEIHAGLIELRTLLTGPFAEKLKRLTDELGKIKAPR